LREDDTGERREEREDDIPVRGRGKEQVYIVVLGGEEPSCPKLAR
jgi:hypothetical protein